MPRSEHAPRRRPAAASRIRTRLHAHFSGGFYPTAWKFAKQLATYLPIPAAAIAIAWTFEYEIFDQSLVVEPISVPKSLVDNGYTPEVTADRINAAVVQMQTLALSGRKTQVFNNLHNPSVSPNSSVSNMPANAPGLMGTIAGLTSSVLHWIHLSSRPHLKGAITQRDDGYVLTLQISDDDIHLGPYGPSRDVDALLAIPARRILWQTRPYMVALYDAPTDRTRAEREAAVIPDRYWNDRRNSNVRNALVLNGILLMEKKDYAGAERRYRDAIDRHRNYSIRSDIYGARLYNYLGTALYRQGPARYDEGEAAFLTAIRKDPNFATPRARLAAIENGRRHFAAALQLAQEAKALAPDHSEAHFQTAVALEGQGKIAQAIKEADRATALDPKDVEIQVALAKYKASMAAKNTTVAPSAVAPSSGKSR